MTLFTLGLAWLAGIALARWLAPPLPVLGLLAVPALAAVLLYRRERGPRLAALCVLALLGGGARLLWATPHFGPDDLAYYSDTGQVRLVGVVAEEPDVRDTYQNLRLRAESMTLPASDGETGGEERAVRGTVLVCAPRYPARAYGERLVVRGRLETPTVFESFDYQEYPARQEVRASTSNRLNADYSLKRSSQVQFAVAATLLGCVGPSLAFCPTQVETSRRGEKRVESSSTHSGEGVIPLRSLMDGWP